MSCNFVACLVVKVESRAMTNKPEAGEVRDQVIGIPSLEYSCPRRRSYGDGIGIEGLSGKQRAGWRGRNRSVSARRLSEGAAPGTIVTNPMQPAER